MLNILVSYAYIAKSNTFMPLIRACAGHARLLLDSGAFTAHVQGHAIELDDYCRFLDSTEGLWWKYIALDVVGDSKRTMANLKKMRARGLNPIPVLTVDAHVDQAVEMTQEADSLCVAGGVTEPPEQYGPRISEVRRRVGPSIWLHGLGFTRGLSVSRTAVDSVDSSTWLSGRRYGAFQWYEPTKGVRHKLWNEMRATPWAKLPPRAREALIGLELSNTNLKSRRMNRGGKSAMAMQSVRAFLGYASALDSRGVRYFFAVTPPDFIQLLIGAKNATRTGVSWAACVQDENDYKSGALTTGQLAQRATKQVQEQWGIR